MTINLIEWIRFFMEGKKRLLKIEYETDKYIVGEIKEFIIEVIEFFKLTASNLPFEEV